MDTLTMAIAFKMLLALGVVLLSFGAAIFVAKKISSKGNLFSNKNNSKVSKPLEILSVQSLGPGKNIYLIRCFDKKVLLGATQNQITHLMDLSDDNIETLFQEKLEEKYPENADQKLKDHFGTSLKEISRI